MQYVCPKIHSVICKLWNNVAMDIDVVTALGQGDHEEC